MVAASAAGCLALVSPPDYTASVTVIARSQGSANDKTLSFIEVATSNELARRVITNLDLHQSVNQLAPRIKVSATSNSELYKVTVTDRNAQLAGRLAHVAGNEAAALYEQLAAGSDTPLATDLDREQTVLRQRYAQALAALVQFNKDHPDAAARKGNPNDVAITTQALQLQLEEQAAASAYVTYEDNASRARVDELSRARGFSASVVNEDPPSADTMARYLRVPYAAAVALLLGVGLVLLIEYVDKRIRDPEALEELMGAPVVAVIPHTLKPVLRSDKGVSG